MPFRIPTGYDHISAMGRDPSPIEVEDYLDWLNSELALCKAWLKANPAPPYKPRKPTESRDSVGSGTKE